LKCGHGSGTAAHSCGPAGTAGDHASRIPPIEEFPAIAQKQIAAQQSRIEDIAEHAQKRKKGIFRAPGHGGPWPP
jgi:hypothetical protein